MRASILAVTLLAACSGQPATDTAANEATGEPVPPASDPLEAPTPAAKAVKVSEENDLYEFEFTEATVENDKKSLKAWRLRSI